MKLYRIIPAAVLPLALLAAADAYAAPFDQYVTVRGTLSRMHNTLDATVSYLGENAGVDGGSDNKSLGGGTLGYGLDFAKKGINVRTELELGFSSKASYNESYSDEDGKNDVSLKFEKQYLLLNGYYDFRNSTPFTPFIGAGVGLARVKASLGYAESDGFGLSQSKSKVNFVYQVGAGASYEAAQNLSLDIGYRFVDYGRVKQSSTIIDGFDVHTKVKAREHQFYAGVRYTFK
jgi:opacity protein-like surface antigen